jgi:hypothetical protein
MRRRDFLIVFGFPPFGLWELCISNIGRRGISTIKEIRRILASSTILLAKAASFLEGREQ